MGLLDNAWGSMFGSGGAKKKSTLGSSGPTVNHGFGGGSALSALQQPAYQQPAYQQPVIQQSWAPGPINSGPVGGGGGGGMSAPIPAPAPPRPSYSMSDPNKKIAQVDSTFADQESAYNTALEKFVANLGKRRTSLETDSKRSREGISKNRDLGLTGLGEDFAARGLGHSGLYIDATEKARNAYQRQDDSVVSALSDGKEELNFSETKERSDTASRVQQAKRDALYRLQMNNNLVTGV